MEHTEAQRSMIELKPRFSGHETFPFRYSWLPKAVQNVDEEPGIFGQDDALVSLGVGKNMVRSMRHWALAAGLVSETVGDGKNGKGSALLAPTDLGRRLFLDENNAWDPYLEDPTTLWLLHWQLASRRSGVPSSWYFLFNHAPLTEFSRQELLQALKTWIVKNGWRAPSDSTLKRDLDCLLRTYVAAHAATRAPVEDTLDCPLVELGLVSELGGRGVYILRRLDGHNIPDELLAYALFCLIESRGQDTKTLALEEVLLSPGSPGRVFCFHEEALRARLEKIKVVTDGALDFDDTSGLRQVMINKRVEPVSFLERYYVQSKGVEE